MHASYFFTVPKETLKYLVPFFFSITYTFSKEKLTLLYNCHFYMSNYNFEPKKKKRREKTIYRLVDMTIDPTNTDNKINKAINVN
jgi:hypothetical protein